MSYLETCRLVDYFSTLTERFISNVASKNLSIRDKKQNHNQLSFTGKWKMINNQESLTNEKHKNFRNKKKRNYYNKFVRIKWGWNKLSASKIILFIHLENKKL